MNSKYLSSKRYRSYWPQVESVQSRMGSHFHHMNLPLSHRQSPQMSNPHLDLVYLIVLLVLTYNKFKPARLVFPASIVVVIVVSTGGGTGSLPP